MQDVHPADRVLAAIGPYLLPGIDRQIVYREILTALSDTPETEVQQDTSNDGASRTESAVVIWDANDPSAFDVAGDQPVKNQPATAKLRAKVRMGHRE